MKIIGIDMANYMLLAPFIMDHEGGYVNNPNDKGGPTNKGVTLATFRRYAGDNMTVQDLREISDKQWYDIFKKYYWNVCMADKIVSQAVANAIVDWAYNSGPKTSISTTQRIVGVESDGIVGPITIAAINEMASGKLFNSIQTERILFINKIIKNNPSQKIFYNGWMNRIRSL